MITLLIINLITIVLLFLLNRFFLFVPLNISFMFGFLLVLVIINIIASVIILIVADVKANSAKDKKLKNLKGIVIGAVLAFVTLLVINFITTGKTINYKEYRELSGKIKEESFAEDMEVVDLSKLPINNSELAKNLADKKLGEVVSLGSQVKIGEFTLQNVNGELYYVAPLEHTGLFKWFNNKGGTSGYMKVNATKANDVELVTELNGQPIKLKYLNSAYFGSDIERYAYSKNSKYGLTDFSFELNNEGRPYYVISIYDKTIGFSGKDVIGTLIVDVQTGESKEYSVEDTPSWVDRIQPKEIVKKDLKNWGKLIHGAWNLSDKDKLTLTDGIKIIYNGDSCYYYTGVTSVGSDESLVGFFLTNTRTGETAMYKMSGAIESAAMSSAEGKVQQFGYNATWPVLVNIQNEPTYFTTLLDSKGLVKNYAFVNIKNYNIVGNGETIQQAYNNYIEGLNMDHSSNLVNSNTVEEVEGTIERIGMFINNNASYYMIALKDNANNFIVPTEISNLVTIAEKGDIIKVSYIPNTTNVITVRTFENKSR